jgi:hypothetical protein
LDEFLLENPLHLSGEKVDGSSRLTLDTTLSDISPIRTPITRSPSSRSPLSRSPIHSQSGGLKRPINDLSVFFNEDFNRLSSKNEEESKLDSQLQLDFLDNTLLRSQKLLESLKSPNLL